MQIDEVSKWVDTVSDTIQFLQKELKDIKSENAEKLKNMQVSLNTQLAVTRGEFKMLESKTVVKNSVEDYLLMKIRSSPQFLKAVKHLEEGDDADLQLRLNVKKKQLPLYIRHEPMGTMTKEFDGNVEDTESKEKVEKRMKLKDRLTTTDGAYSYED